jgi:hypothetical protein
MPEQVHLDRERSALKAADSEFTNESSVDPEMGGHTGVLTRYATRRGIGQRRGRGPATLEEFRLLE